MDAVLLDGRSGRDSKGVPIAPDDAALDELIREASRHQLRVLMTVTPAMQGGSRPALLQTVHDWLSAGAAGVWVPKPSPESAAGDAVYANLDGSLAAMLRGFPGERILLAEPAPGSEAVASPHPAHPAHSPRVSRAARLTLVAALPAGSASASALRQALQAVADDSTPGMVPLLRFSSDPPTGAPTAAAAAAMLFTSRGAAMFDFGDEIGLDAFPGAGARSSGTLPVMQWTPANVQQAPVERHIRSAPQVGPDGQTPFGPYTPYVRPPPSRLTGPAPSGPHVGIDGNIPPPAPDPNTLRGFTTASLPAEPAYAGRVNVATEERDPDSLLNAYRQLIALHEGDSTLRNGVEQVLNRDAQNAVVWIRRPAAGSRTGESIVVAGNLGSEPITLSLDGDLQQMGVATGPLHPMFTWSPTPLTGETTAVLKLPPHAVFIGNVLHFGRYRGSAPGRR